MKSLLFAVSLAAALIALPAVAQQGPAGVPGAPGLAPPPPPPVAAAPLPPAAPTKLVQRSPQDCRKGKVGSAGKSCGRKTLRAANCSGSADPGRCERYQKTRELCKELLGREHRQCLRDNLTAKK